MPNSPFIQLAEIHTDDWRRLALCTYKDGDIWFPESGGGPGVNDDARKICWECPAQKQCLQWALDHNERGGLWGAFNEKERELIKRGHMRPVKPIRFVGKQCSQCGGEFKPLTKRAKYCSDGCKKRAFNAARSEPKQRVCTQCGDVFFAAHAQTCSNECRRRQRWGA